MPSAPFSPNATTTCTLACTQTSGNVAITMLGAQQIELTNKDTANWIYVALGTSSAITATVPSGSTGSYPVGPGQSKIVSADPANTTYVAGICDSGKTATLFATPGNGLS